MLRHLLKLSAKHCAFKSKAESTNLHPIEHNLSNISMVLSSIPDSETLKLSTHDVEYLKMASFRWMNDQLSEVSVGSNLKESLIKSGVSRLW